LSGRAIQSDGCESFLILFFNEGIQPVNFRFAISPLGDQFWVEFNRLAGCRFRAQQRRNAKPL
jgi:hypothetical protein